MKEKNHFDIIIKREKNCIPVIVIPVQGDSPARKKVCCLLLGFKSGLNSELFAYWLYIYIYTGIHSLSIQ